MDKILEEKFFDFLETEIELMELDSLGEEMVAGDVEVDNKVMKFNTEMDYLKNEDKALLTKFEVINARVSDHADSIAQKYKLVQQNDDTGPLEASYFDFFKNLKILKNEIEIKLEEAQDCLKESSEGEDDHLTQHTHPKSSKNPEIAELKKIQKQGKNSNFQQKNQKTQQKEVLKHLLKHLNQIQEEQILTKLAIEKERAAIEYLQENPANFLALEKIDPNQFSLQNFVKKRNSLNNLIEKFRDKNSKTVSLGCIQIEEALTKKSSMGYKKALKEAETLYARYKEEELKLRDLIEKDSAELQGYYEFNVEMNQGFETHFKEIEFFELFIKALKSRYETESLLFKEEDVPGLFDLYQRMEGKRPRMLYKKKHSDLLESAQIRKFELDSQFTRAVETGLLNYGTKYMLLMEELALNTEKTGGENRGSEGSNSGENQLKESLDSLMLRFTDLKQKLHETNINL